MWRARWPRAKQRARLFRQLANEFKALENMLLAIASEKAFSPRSQDSLLGAGETLSVPIGAICVAIGWSGGDLG